MTEKLKGCAHCGAEFPALKNHGGPTFGFTSTGARGIGSATLTTKAKGRVSALDLATYATRLSRTRSCKRSWPMHSPWSPQGMRQRNPSHDRLPHLDLP